MRQTFQRAPKGDSADEVGRPHHGGDSAGNGRDNAIGHYGAQKAGPFSADSLSSGASGAFSGSKLPNVIVIAAHSGLWEKPSAQRNQKRKRHIAPEFDPFVFIGDAIWHAGPAAPLPIFELG